MTKSELISKGYKVSHTSYTRGYVKVGREVVVAYKGRFGEGFKVLTNNNKSSRYCHVTYLLKE